ncbi:MAG: hypothetical protein H7293_02585 [Candidatus Saccharibacteria bacterium]|nr:hypothetical protein [Rhodoferax sp.]
MGVLFNEREMDLAVSLWRAIHDRSYREQVEKLAAIGNQWDTQYARKLLDACDSLDPTEIYAIVEEMRPSSYVIAQLVLMAKAAQKTQSARNSEGKMHKENRAMKAEVFHWLDANMPNFKSMDAAAQAITKQQPIVFRTAQAWVGEWKKVRSTGTP